MLIGIDGNEANISQKVGVGRYSFELLSHIHHQIRNRNNTDIKVFLKNKPSSDLPLGNSKWHYEVFGPVPLWTRLALPFRLFMKKPSPDIFFTPSHYGPLISPCPTAISVMDLSFLYYPELFRKKDLFQLTEWTKYSAKKASAIFTISENSKKDLLERYGISPEKVIVTYPGYDKNRFNRVSLKKQVVEKKYLQKAYGIDNEYVLFVGTIQPRKNIIRLIDAFEQIARTEKHLQLVLVGKKGWLYEPTMRRISDSPYRKRILMIDYMKDSDLPSLYREAFCFVLPSLYEGFGLPVVEAMACGCPVIVSNTTSLPEVVGEAGIFVRPDQTDDIISAIQTIIGRQSERTKLISEGLKQAESFSWETCASRTLETLIKVVH